MRSSTLILALMALTALPVHGGDSLPDPVTARILPGWVQEDGSRIAALELRLLPGWKTYWRAPGDAGIPPQFNWSGSRNLAEISVTWPAPIVFVENGMRSIGYKDTLVIPLRLSPKTPDTAMRLRVKMDLGVCSDICMPHQVTFDAPLDSQATLPTPSIVAALAQAPYSADEAGVTQATCALSPLADGLRIEARVTMPSAGAREVMVIEPGQGDIWVSESDTHRSGNTVIAVSDMMHVNGGAIALDRKKIRLTVLGSSHAVDIHGCTAG